jgi:hypothetical protein
MTATSKSWMMTRIDSHESIIYNRLSNPNRHIHRRNRHDCTHTLGTIQNPLGSLE